MNGIISIDETDALSIKESLNLLNKKLISEMELDNRHLYDINFNERIRRIDNIIFELNIKFNLL